MTSRLFRLLAGTAVLGTGSLAAMTGTASAATEQSSATPPAVCRHLSGSASTLTASLTDCTATVTGGSGSIAHFEPKGGIITWRNGTTTTYRDRFTNSGTLCPAPTVEFDIRGSVTGGTNTAIPAGAPVRMVVCSNGTTGALTNATGTTVKF
jgi:hypothetical protein